MIFESIWVCVCLKITPYPIEGWDALGEDNSDNMGDGDNDHMAREKGHEGRGKAHTNSSN